MRGACPACGAPAASATDATVVGPPVSESARKPRSAPSHIASNPAERFAPGEVLLDRYRVLGKVGAGGMGEVYRAEDRTLDQIVALKFLPPAFSQHEEWRRRFLQEVRLARQVSHPNLCRVYDVGDIDGELFLSMEFVEGRDLGSVLRSIGRLPQEKAIDIARQLCAGLAALHDRDVLHRDLKPANVMLDDEGRVRITDFGLAGIQTELVGAEIRSGTPQYMAPEQLEGREVTVRSDIYALGLVLYELFTGEATFHGDTVQELTEMHRSAAPSRLSTHVHEIDPAVDRIVSKCLEKDPGLRPPSALVVSTALPGGDPLAAALAMGETPSPELVAASGGTGGLHPLLAIGLFLLAFVGIVLHAGDFGEKKLVHYFDIDRSAGALEERARQLVEDIGYTEEPVDRYRSFARSGDMLNWVAEQDSTQERWSKLSEARPSPLLFWYRQSPRHLQSTGVFENVSINNPPPVLTGMLRVTLDASGRLVYFTAVPEEELEAGAESDSAAALLEQRWDRLFEAARIVREDFREVPPEWIPDQFASQRRAWTGEIESLGQSIPFTVEAGAVGGRPVYFRTHGPWTSTRRTVEGGVDFDGLQFFIVILVLGVLAAGASLAWRNLQRGRADMAGAGRLAAFLLCMPIVWWLFVDHHAPLPQALLNRFFEATAVGALYALFCVVLYLALEPIVRRVWPTVLIGWSRLRSGEWRDPMVGRSILAGGAMFGATSVLFELSTMVAKRMQVPPPTPESTSFQALASPQVVLGTTAIQIPNSLFNALFFLMILVLGRLLLRKAWAAYLLFFGLAALVIGSAAPDPRIGWVLGPLAGFLWTFVMVRLGMLAFFTGFMLTNLLNTIPLTFDFGQVYAGPSFVVAAVYLVLLFVAMASAMGGRSIWGRVSEAGRPD